MKKTVLIVLIVKSLYCTMIAEICFNEPFAVIVVVCGVVVFVVYFYVLLGKHFVYTAVRHVQRSPVGLLMRHICTVQICDSTAHSVPSCLVSRPFSELPEAAVREFVRQHGEFCKHKVELIIVVSALLRQLWVYVAFLC